jgi:hypothetical protein
LVEGTKVAAAGPAAEFLDDRTEMASSAETLQTIVGNWLTDVRRRGVELFASNRGDALEYFAFEGKDQVRFNVEIDYAVQGISVRILDPRTKVIETEELALNAENLRSLARRMCPLKEGQAVIPVYLLAQLAILCHVYERLVQDFDKERGFQTSTATVAAIEAELREFLTPEEQKRTDNPLIVSSRERREK